MKVAIAWLRKEDWPRWQAIDPNLPPYDRWHSKISTAIELAERAGADTEKVTIDPDEFVSWCKANNCSVTRENRAAYATQQLAIRKTTN